MGECCSMGTILLAAGTPGKRVISKRCELMVHKHAMGAWGKHDELVATMKGSSDEAKRQVQFWLEHSRYKSERELKRRLLTVTDNWLTAQEALGHGIVDYVIGEPEEKEEEKKEPVLKTRKVRRETPPKKKAPIKKAQVKKKVPRKKSRSRKV